MREDNPSNNQRMDGGNQSWPGMDRDNRADANAKGQTHWTTELIGMGIGLLVLGLISTCCSK